MRRGAPISSPSEVTGPSLSMLFPTKPVVPNSHVQSRNPGSSRGSVPCRMRHEAPDPPEPNSAQSPRELSASGLRYDLHGAQRIFGSDFSTSTNGFLVAMGPWARGLETLVQNELPKLRDKKPKTWK